MHISNKIFSLSAEKINMGNACLMWPQAPDSTFVNSLQNFGQLCPVLVKVDNEHCQLVAGYKRLMGLKVLGLDVACQEIKADDFECGLSYLLSNQGRAIDEAMQLKALRYFQKHGSMAQIEQDVLPLLGIAGTSRQWKWWQAWLDFSEDKDFLLLEGHICLATITAISKLRSEELDALLPYLQAVNWSKSNANNFISWLWEAARYQQLELSKLIASSSLLQILNKELSPKDLTAAFLQAAKELRFANLMHLEKQFQARIRSVVGGTLWRAVKDDNFETKAITISCRLKDRSTLDQAIDELQMIQNAGLWGDDNV